MENPDLSQKARLHLEQYSFPVEMMVALPNGTVVGVVGFFGGENGKHVVEEFWREIEVVAKYFHFFQKSILTVKIKKL